MNNDKKLIIKYTIKEKMPLLLALLIFFIIVVLINKINNEIKLFILLFLGLGLGILILFLIFRILFILLSKDIKLVDGYICERTQRYDSEGIDRFYGKAKTLDENKITGRQDIPKDFVSGQIPVKILVHNNSAIRFFITEESYNYVREQHKK